ncbi:hypothetical protein CALCODRAFT_519207 [Calocera cornea HHB12733]|uniref:P-loop containing nucleoside triphosphate hydrolase protein n=1 Tax=Calocera cornea HHB12733 TaxID=1353952 RepID=A0A165EEI5_9BASI|nr:hypothetical protein CALCODRAFT_519207 [Calocera cornea HHB12733]
MLGSNAGEAIDLTDEAPPLPSHSHSHSPALSTAALIPGLPAAGVGGSTAAYMPYSITRQLQGLHPPSRSPSVIDLTRASPSPAPTRPLQVPHVPHVPHIAPHHLLGLPHPHPHPHPQQPQARPAADADKQPICIGQLKLTCLILYPSPYIHSPSPAAQGAIDLAPVKWSYRPPVKAGPSTLGETINVLEPESKDSFGVVEQKAANVLGPMLGRGLLRVDAKVFRTTDPRPTMLPLYVLVFTLPPNVPVIADLFIKANLYLDNPAEYSPALHHGAVLRNPHNPPPGGWAARYRQPLGLVGPGAVQPPVYQSAQKTVEVQRGQVDELFKSLRSGSDLRETDPPAEIGTRLYPHQKQALTFLLEREGELKGGGTLFEQINVAGKRIFRCRVTGVQFGDLPPGPRGALLADDMGLGKTITVVSLIAATMSSARQYGSTPQSSRSALKPAFPKPLSKLKPQHFAGAVWGMPSGSSTPSTTSTSASTSTSTSSSAATSHSATPSPHALADSLTSLPHGSKSKKAEKAEKAERKRQQAEYARLARLRCRSRATLIVCPLSTVMNWEEQLREHWAGKVTVFGGGGVVTPAPAAHQAEVEVPNANQGVWVQHHQREEEKAPLKVYVYHGNARRPDPDFLADFDVVITTYSTLATEFSRQVRTGASAEDSEDESGNESGEPALNGNGTASAAGSASGTSTPNGGGAIPIPIPIPRGYVDVDDESDGIVEVDGEGQLVPPKVGPTGRALAGQKRKRIGTPGVEQSSPLQQVDWFRIVLDEAHSIKETSTVASRASCDLVADRRICLTGTPVQNKLDDVYALIKFIRLQPFDDKAMWTEYIGGPCKFGQPIGVARLQTIMKNITLRRTKDTKSPDGTSILALPPRKDELRMLQLDPQEKAIYDRVYNASKEEFENMSKKGEVMKNYVGILQRILRLRQICDHWQLVQERGDTSTLDDSELEPEELISAIQKDGINLARATAVFNLLRESATSTCVECGYELSLAAPQSDDPDAESEAPRPTKRGPKKARVPYGQPGFIPRVVMTRCQHLFCMKCYDKAVCPNWPKVDAAVRRPCSVCHHTLGPNDAVEISPYGTMPDITVEANKPKTTAVKRKEKADRQLLSGQDVAMSTKIKTLMNDLISSSRANPFSRNYDPNSIEIETTDAKGNITNEGVVKTVVFSQWTSMLDKIEDALTMHGIHFDRLDGTMRRDERTRAMEALKTDPACEVLLVSLRAGGVGLNLTAAQRVYLMDPYWNPAVENQAVDRIHRLGQTRPVTTIKLVIENTVEARMLDVQKRKTALANLTLGGTNLTRSQIAERRMEELRVLFR